jgi:PAS domain S-box-containing protein
MDNDKHFLGRSWINQRMAFILMAMVAIGTIFTWWTVKHTDRCLRESLLYQAWLVTQAIRPERVGALSGTTADLTSPTYHRLKEQLAATRAIIPKCRFLYLMGRRADGSVFFFVDSEPVGSADESPPGQIYEEITDADLQAFNRQVSLTSGPATDRWGTWISAMVPLIHPDGKRLTAVLGMDIAAHDWQKGLVRAALPPMLLTLLMTVTLVTGLILFHRYARLTGRFVFQHRYQETILAIAVMGVFLSVSAAWLVRDKGDLARMRAFRQLAQDKTAAISHALNSLHYIELEGLARFFEASHYVSPAEFMDYTSYLMKNPATEYWAWAKWMPATERNEINARLYAGDRSEPMIWQHGRDGRRIPAAPRDVYFPIVHVAPLVMDKDLLGYDLGSDAFRRAELQTAIQSGLTTCIISTHPDTDRPTTVEVFRPTFYKDGTNRPQGVGMALLVPGNLLSGVRLHGTVQLALAMGEKSGSVIEPLVVSVGKDHRSDHAISVIYPIFVFGKAFLVTARAGKAFKGLFPSQVPWLVITAGVMLTALLAVPVAMAYRKRDRLEALVAERTRDLIDARHRMELAVNGADLGTWEWQIPADKMIVNENWARMLGYGMDEIGPLLEDWQQLTVSADKPAVSRAMGLHLKGKSDFYEIEHRLRHKAGHDVWVLSKGRVIEKDADGRPVRVCGTCLDTTRHRAVKEALKISEARLRTLLDTLPDMVWLKDPQGVFLACNKRLERLFAAKEADIIGKTDYDFVEPAQADFFREKDQAAINAGKACLNEEEVIFADDGHTELIETIKTPMFDPQGRLIGVLGIARDITERKRAQKDREKLQEQLLQSQKIEAVGQLAGGVAHDLNNLLSPIIGYGELLRLTLDGEDERSNAVDAILNAGFRARDLVHQLLAFSRKQTLDVKPVSLNRIIEEFQNLLRRTIPEDIIMDVVLTPQNQTVMADVGQIEQVIMNLAVNAADAMPDGGRLTIETASVVLDDTYAASHPSVRPGPFLMLAVSDTGCGMDAATCKRIFEPFFSTKGKRGTGLGLATVFGIVKQHNGSIWVYSEPKKGTTFKVYLPITDAVEGGSEIHLQADVDLTGTETILLVEDNQPVRLLVQEILIRQGYTILSATTGEEALAMAADHNGPVHLLLTDVVMPGMNGKELYGKAVATNPGLKILYMSGYTDEVIAHRGVLDSGIAFIQKPFTVEAIAIKVREVLDQP